MIEIRRLSGKAIAGYLAEVAELRIKVFREFPYLYDGDVAYERDYLEAYADSESAVLVLAFGDGRIVGASTGLPLIDAGEEFRQPFTENGIDPKSVFYFGESVLEHEWRGRGIGHRFFDEREAHARELGFKVTAFCAVTREADHPLKPADHRVNDAFWIKRGYSKTNLEAELEWKQIDGAGEQLNSLVFWLKHWE